MVRLRFLADRFFVGLFCVLLASLSGCDYLLPKEKVYVTVAILNLREKPTTKSQVVERLQRGRELEIFERANPWLRVRTDGKTEGWVHGNYVGDAAAVRAALQKDLARRSGTRKKRPVVRPTQPATEPQVTQETQTTQPSPGALSIDGMIAGMPDDLILEEVDPLEGQPRHFGATGSGQVVLEFWGPEADLLRSEIMVTVLDISDADLNHNADLVRLFIQNAVPQWQRDTPWVANFLRELSSQDVGTGGFDTRSKTVRFRFIKPLSAIRVTIEKAS
ncbi:MAG: SH3 domain-containing protein [Gemmatimonadetes bacterium]|nr:SH3 domain-containing protein [Gemmatimonadota bacterium]